jgi:hypothetical protein
MKNVVCTRLNYCQSWATTELINEMKKLKNKIIIKEIGDEKSQNRKKMSDFKWNITVYGYFVLS